MIYQAIKEIILKLDEYKVKETSGIVEDKGRAFKYEIKQIEKGSLIEDKKWKANKYLIFIGVYV